MRQQLNDTILMNHNNGYFENESESRVETTSLRHYTLRYPLLANIYGIEDKLKLHLLQIKIGNQLLQINTDSIRDLQQSLIAPSSKSNILYCNARDKGVFGFIGKLRESNRCIEIVARGMTQDFYNIESFLRERKYILIGSQETTRSMYSFLTGHTTSCAAKERALIGICNSLGLEYSLDWNCGRIDGNINGMTDRILQIRKFLLENGRGMKIKSENIQFY